MDDLLDHYKKKQPHIVFEWKDTETDATGWIVINSLRNGACGGGTRMRKGLNRLEVEYLAKVMEIKFTVSGPSIGGAKSGINFDPSHPDRKGVLNRWFQAVIPILKNYYGTGGDLNVDELKDVIPITESYGLWHPQEGVVNGHLKSKEKDKIKIIGQLRQGVSKIIEDKSYSPSISQKWTIADMITGFGVAASLEEFYSIYKNQSLKNQKVLIQGWGNVAAAAGFYLAKKGALICGILDKELGLIDESGLSVEKVTELFNNRNGNQLADPEASSNTEIDKKFWDIPADIFLPCAASRLINKGHLERLLKSGVHTISSGANVPFDDEDPFYGPTTAFADENFSLIPDFIANCGMARTFAYLMENDIEISDKNIFNDVQNTIKQSLEECKTKSDKLRMISQNGLQIALQKLM
ncbi:MAG: amino acid dehydrogenase [Chitinophagaceae bacterium]|nr:MAG: amino acid dehydrogenase [Chitinophagaceae bacterium]